MGAHPLTLPQSVVKGMRINQHNELVRVRRDAILHSETGNAKVYAYLVPTRDDKITSQVCILWLFRGGYPYQDSKCPRPRGATRAVSFRGAL